MAGIRKQPLKEAKQLRNRKPSSECFRITSGFQKNLSMAHVEDSLFTSPIVLCRNHPLAQGVAHSLKRRIPDENGESTASIIEDTNHFRGLYRETLCVGRLGHNPGLTGLTPVRGRDIYKWVVTYLTSGGYNLLTWPTKVRDM